jgi:hypothetical protein
MSGFEEENPFAVISWKYQQQKNGPNVKTFQISQKTQNLRVNL